MRRTSRTLVVLLVLCACDSDDDTTSPDADGSQAPLDATIPDGARDATMDAELPAVDSGALDASRDAAQSADAHEADSAQDASTADSGPPLPGTCTPPANIDQPYDKLSDTGCMDPDVPTALAARVIPYEVNSPLWSDSADKQRGFVLPEGATIAVKDCEQTPSDCPQGAADDGKWVFPVGTVFVKSFSFDDKLVETRLFVRFDETTWVGYSYQWNEQQTEATIVPDERRTVTFDTGMREVEWNYPSRIDCMKCHNPAGGSSLGPETAQLNRVVDGMNQIDRFAALDLFEDAPGMPYAAPLVTPYAGQAGEPPQGATVDERARSYLHANCGFCHRPDGDFASIDMRRDVAFADMHLCNVVPEKGDVGVATATVLTPGEPMQSVTWLRMNAEFGNGRMPQIGTFRVDEDALSLISDWIESIDECP